MPLHWIERAISFRDSLEPGAWHSAPCAWDDDDGCADCSSEYDEASEQLMDQLARAGLETYDVILVNRPRDFANEEHHQHADDFWLFALAVRSSA